MAKKLAKKKISKRKRVRSSLPMEPNDQGLFENARSRGTSATCFFNNKGGVGKTTLVANLAAELALNFKARVLVVDADPQCNLTQYVLGEVEATRIYSQDDPESVFKVIRPISLGRGYSDKLPIIRSESFGFDVIIGDPRLALQEDLLAGDWRDARGGGMRGIRTTFVFAELVRQAKKLKYDFVFFDMGPSLGAINRAVLLAMDYFVVPMSIDIFSVWAIKNIGATVGVWKRELETGLKLAEEPDELKDLVSWRLRFLGYVTQQHKERTGYDRKAGEAGEEKKVRRRVQAYEDIGAIFPKEVEKNLKEFYEKKVINPHLGDIRHLGSLAPRSQSQHVPMISVAGTGSYTLLRKQAREIYRKIARRFLENAVAC
ncbi:ParA family protein [Dongia sp. agr-C8]